MGPHGHWQGETPVPPFGVFFAAAGSAFRGGGQTKRQGSELLTYTVGRSRDLVKDTGYNTMRQIHKSGVKFEVLME